MCTKFTFESSAAGLFIVLKLITQCNKDPRLKVNLSPFNIFIIGICLVLLSFQVWRRLRIIYLRISWLKRHNQAKIIIFNFAPWYVHNTHIHRLDLRKFFIFCVAHLPVKWDIRTIFNFWHAYTKQEIQEKLINGAFGTLITTLQTATQNLKESREYNLWTCSHIMAISRSQNKNNYLFIILAIISELLLMKMDHFNGCYWQPSRSWPLDDIET